ncbi:MAG TPA: hypothetical protein VF241_13935 [Propionibacteriaceae bacterium]
MAPSVLSRLGVALNSAPSLEMEDAMWTSGSAESGAIVSVLPKPDPPTTMIHTGSSDPMIKFTVTAARTVRNGTRS